MQPNQILVSCTKGILNDTLETPNQVHCDLMYTPSMLQSDIKGGSRNTVLYTSSAPFNLQILQRVLPEALHGRLAYLSGPSFAAEVARELPTVVTIAARNDAVAARAQALLSTPRFRCYRTTDIVGTLRQNAAVIVNHWTDGSKSQLAAVHAALCCCHTTVIVGV